MTAWVTGPGRPGQQLHCDWLPVELPEDVLADPRVHCTPRKLRLLGDHTSSNYD